MSVRVATLHSSEASTRLQHVLNIGLLSLKIAPTDATGKRKAMNRTHDGFPTDSSNSVRVVALSRLLASREASIVEASAQTPIGFAFIAALQTIVLRVALSHAGANQGMTELQVQTFFNMACSYVQAKRLYDGGISLPTLWPHDRAKALLEALLETLSVVRADPQAYALAQQLLTVPPPPYNDAAAANLAAVVQTVEAGLVARFVGGGDGGGRGGRSGGRGAGSSSNGASSSGGPPTPEEELIPVAAAVELPSEVDTRLTLGANALRLLEARLARVLLPAEVGRLNELLLDSLTILEGDAARRAEQVGMPLAAVLVERSGSLLWASVVSAVGFDAVASVASFGRVLARLAGEFSGALLIAVLDD